MGEYALGPLATFSLGVFNGEGANSIANRDSTLMLVSRVTARPIPQVWLGASFTRDGSDTLRWGVDVLLQQSGGFVRAEYITRHVDGRGQDEDDCGWYFLEGFRVTPRIHLIARQEDFQRPTRGAAARINAYAFGGNWEIAANRIRLLLEYLSKRSGPTQTRTKSYIAQMQVVF